MEAFPTIQRGVGHPGGVQEVIHVVQSKLTSNPTQKNITIRTDVKRAFQEVRRHFILEGFYQCDALKSFWDVAYMAYGRAAPLLIKHRGQVVKVLSSEVGSRQGCVFGSLSYAAAVQSRLVKLQEDHPQVIFCAIIDDVTITGPPDAACAAFQALAQCYEDMGLVMQGKKCKALWPYVEEPTPDCMLRLQAKFGIELVYDALPLLGSVIALDPKSIQDWMSDKLKKADSFFSAMGEPLLSPQMVTHLLRISGATLMNHIVSTIDPRIIKDHLESFDKTLLDTFKSKLGLPDDISELSEALIHLPISGKISGLGLPSITINAPGLYVGCVMSHIEALVPYTLDFFSQFNTLHPLSEALTHHVQALTTSISPKKHNWWIFKAVQAAIESKEDTLSHLTDSSSTENSCAGVAHTLNSWIVSKSTRRVSLLAESAAEKAMLVSQSQEGATEWLLTHPIDHFSHISDHLFRLCIRSFLHIIVSHSIPNVCICGVDLGDLTHFGVNAHFMVCTSLAGFRTRRHNCVRDYIKLFCSQAGIQASTEVFVGNHKKDGSKCRTDIMDWCSATSPKVADGGVGHDVVITTCVRKDLADIAKDVPLHAADVGNKRKFAVYSKLNMEPLEEFQNAKFLPFAMEDTGALHPTALATLDCIARARKGFAHPLGMSSEHSVAEFKSRLSVVIQRENAKALAHIIAATKRKSHRMSGDCR
jgi:hypothetical protein